MRAAVTFSMNCRVESAQVKVRAWARAHFGEIASAAIAARPRSSSRTPAPLSATTSIGPGAGKAATGRPLAMASSSTMPNVSVRLGKTKTSEDA
jgi:hypothetical protein